MSYDSNEEQESERRYVAPSSTQEFVKNMVHHVPCLRPQYEEHVEYYGELLPHLFLYAVLEYVAANTSSLHATNEVALLLDVVERGLVAGDPDVIGLIDVSFAEDMYGMPVARAPLKQLCGPLLAALMRKHGVF